MDKTLRAKRVIVERSSSPVFYPLKTVLTFSFFTRTVVFPERGAKYFANLIEPPAFSGMIEDGHASELRTRRSNGLEVVLGVLRISTILAAR